MTTTASELASLKLVSPMSVTGFSGDVFALDPSRLCLTLTGLETLSWTRSARGTLLQLGKVLTPTTTPLSLFVTTQRRMGFSSTTRPIVTTVKSTRCLHKG